MKTSARKELGRLEPDLGLRVLEAIEGLAEQPRPTQCRKLKGSDNSYRIRIGKTRVLYQINDRSKSVIVQRVRHRRDVYR